MIGNKADKPREREDPDPMQQYPIGCVILSSTEDIQLAGEWEYLGSTFFALQTFYIFKKLA